MHEHEYGTHLNDTNLRQALESSAFTAELSPEALGRLVGAAVRRQFTAGSVLFREGDRSFETFSQSASYLFGADPRETWYDLAQRTLECTKRMLGLQVYASLQVMGTAFFADYVEQMVDLTQRFAQRIQARPHWAVATEPDCNILCFRYAPPHLADAEAFQSQVRERIVKEGSFYLVKTKLAGQTWLRTTLINPCTELGDLEALLDRVEAEAKAT